MVAEAGPLLLEEFRALDLSDQKGVFCARVLGDLGMDVIRVEPPGGHPMRRIGPFFAREADPEQSLFWWFHNANKRGITLDIEKPAGAGLLRRLVRGCDILIESFEPGHMSRLGLGPQDLLALNPRLVVVSITHFGQTGPYSGWKSSDLIDMSMGGYTYVVGYQDRPPVRIGVPHSWPQAGAQAAAGAMTAFYHALVTGEGQQVDVSIQESVLNTLNSAVQNWEMAGQIPSPRGEPARYSRLQSQWVAKDGYVYFTIGAGLVPSNGAGLYELMKADALTDGIEPWDLEGIGERTDVEALERQLREFFARHTKKELWDWAVRDRIFLYPVNTPRDIVEMEHLGARGFFQPLRHEDLGVDVSYPGSFALVSGERLRLRRRAPHVGEHNEEAYLRDFALGADEFRALQEQGVV